MSENASEVGSEAPQSPAIVKKAAGTVPKIKPKPAIPAVQPSKPAPQADVAHQIEPQPAKEASVFNVFGWDI
jgi:hypothetical protein